MSDAKKILVTGWNGLIGQWLLRALPPEFEAITLSRNPHSHIQADITQAMDMKRLLADLPPLYACVHLAADLTFHGDFWGLHQSNVAATRNLMGILSQHGLELFVLASSIEAVGPQDIPGLEPDQCLARPVSRYGYSKLLAERAVQRADQGGMLRGVNLRLGCTYAPGRPNFLGDILSILQNEKHEAWSFLALAGERPLQLIHAEDVARGIISALVSPSVHGVYSLSGPEAVSINDLFSMMGNMAGLETRTLEDCRYPKNLLQLTARNLAFAGRGECDLTTYLTSGNGARAYGNQKTQAQLGFAPRVSLEEGIKQWFAAPIP